MSTPHACPVCRGTGLVSRPPFVAVDTPTWAASTTGPYRCNACNGSGIVWNHLSPTDTFLQRANEMMLNSFPDTENGPVRMETIPTPREKR